MTPPPHPSDPSGSALNDRDGRDTGRTTRPTVRETTCVYSAGRDRQIDSERE